MSERPPRIAADGVYRIIAGALLGKKCIPTELRRHRPSQLNDPRDGASL
ncbi:hypothetical protein ACVMIH_007984 [Bradyrhizobium sp. USDA 4503]